MTKMNFKQVIRQNYQFLLKRLNPSHDFFGGLQQNEALRNKLASIKEQPTSTDKVDALLSVLLDVRDDRQDSVMGDVIEALRTSGQRHIANIFRKVSEEVFMSDEHYRQLQTKTAELSKYMDPENQLLEELRSSLVISGSEAERIRSASGRNEMTRILIEMCLKKSDDVFEMLVKALNEVGQSHVAYILTGEGNARPVCQKLRDKLFSNRVELIGSIYFKGLPSALISRRVFTEYDQQHVESRPTENEKIERTLDLIARKSHSAFYEFLVALGETHQEHVVQVLMGSEIAAEVIIRDAAGCCTANLVKELRKVMQDAFEKDENCIKALNDVLDESETYFTGVEEGSIIVKFRCKNAEALREMHRSKELDKLFTETFCSSLVHKGLGSIQLQIEDSLFQQCADRSTALKLMTPEHREALTSSAKFLVDKMVVSDDLLDKLPLCRDRRQAVEAAATREEQVRTLLDIVSRQPDSAFKQLLDALTDTRQEQSALILGTPAPLLDLRDEETLPQQPAAARRAAENSLRHLISKLPAIDNETERSISNLRTSLSTVRQGTCSATAQRSDREEANVTGPQQIDACHSCSCLKMTEVAGDVRVTAKQPILVPNSTQTSQGNQLVTENSKSVKCLFTDLFFFPITVTTKDFTYSRLPKVFDNYIIIRRPIIDKYIA